MQNSFDAMVTGLSSDERRNLLKKIEAQMRPQTAVEKKAAKRIEKKEDFDGDLLQKLDQESIFIKFIFWIRKVLLGADVKSAYNDFLIGKKAAEIMAETPNMIDSRRRIFMHGFYMEMQNLRNVAEYFAPFVEMIGKRETDFSVFVALTVAPERFNAFNVEMQGDENAVRFFDKSFRQAFIAKFETSMREMPAGEKAEIQNCLAVFEWMQVFVQLPIRRICDRFFSMNSSEKMICQMATLQIDLPDIAKVMQSMPNITGSFVEILILFASKFAGDEQDDEDEKSFAVNFGGERFSQNVKRMTEQFVFLQSFLQIVPLDEICKVVENDYFWDAGRMATVGDSFFVFQSQWKLYLQDKIDAAVLEQKRKIAYEHVNKFFNCATPPRLSARPWESAWCNLQFPYDRTAGFLVEFFEKHKDSVGKPLKTLLIEGEFCLVKNRVDFSEAVNTFNKLEFRLSSMNFNLSPLGDIGRAFALGFGEMKHTLQSRNKLYTLVTSLKTETAEFVADFAKMAEVVKNIVHGVVSGARSGQYETISNLTTIQGGGNVHFRESLLAASNSLSNAREILSEVFELENEN